MMRLFVGLPLDAAIAGRLEVLAAGIPGARWVAARNLHLTLRFIGEVDEAAAQEIHEVLEGLTAPAFSLNLDGFGTFGGRKAHTLWARVSRPEPLERLQGKIDAAAVRAGLPPEPRKFAPHVTLARLEGSPVARVQDFIARNSPFHAGPWPVDAFILFRSHLSRGGAEYEAVADYPLSGPVQSSLSSEAT